jgi:hypothetical protein
MKRRFLRVAKVGGSLFDFSDLPTAIRSDPVGLSWRRSNTRRTTPHLPPATDTCSLNVLRFFSSS